MHYPDGSYSKCGECMLFPSKVQRNWDNFLMPFKNGDIIIRNANPQTLWTSVYFSSATMHDLIYTLAAQDQICVAVMETVHLQMHRFGYAPLCIGKKDDYEKNIIITVGPGDADRHDANAGICRRFGIACPRKRSYFYYGRQYFYFCGLSP